jgi:hypothetical protein
MTRRKLLSSAALVLVGIPVALYAFLFALQAYSVWQASRTLDKLEALRLGDSAQDCDRALKHLRLEDGMHTMATGGYRFERPLSWIWKTRLAYKDIPLADRAGLRSWKLWAGCGTKDGRVSSVTAMLIVNGKEEALGAGWWLTSVIPDFEPRHEPDRNVATHVGSFSIDGSPNGAGVKIYTTARSSSAGLAARRVNRSCLLSFRGCESFCQLLPQAVPLFEEGNLTSFACQSLHWIYGK